MFFPGLLTTPSLQIMLANGGKVPPKNIDILSEIGDFWGGKLPTPYLEVDSQTARRKSTTLRAQSSTWVYRSSVPKYLSLRYQYLTLVFI